MAKTNKTHETSEILTDFIAMADNEQKRDERTS